MHAAFKVVMMLLLLGLLRLFGVAAVLMIKPVDSSDTVRGSMWGGLESVVEDEDDDNDVEDDAGAGSEEGIKGVAGLNVNT